MNSQISLAAIHINFNECISPYSAHTLEKLSQYFDQNRLYEQLGLPREHLLKAHSLVNDYMFPRGRVDRLFATGSLMTYFYLFDYIYDADFQQKESIKIIRDHLSEDLISSLENQKLEHSDSCDFLKVIMEILANLKTTPHDWHVLFNSELKKYIQATVRGKLYAREFRKLSLKDYLHVREKDCGGWWSANLIEYANDLYLTPEARSKAEVVKLTRFCVWICSLINDLFSFPKEMESEEHPFNAVYFCMNYEEISEKRAVQFLIEKLNQLIDEFKTLRKNEIFQCSPAMKSYAQGLEDFVSGIWYWHQHSGIYTHPKSLFVELRSS